MYGAVFLRSRICGVLMNAVFGGGVASQPSGGLAPAPGAGVAGGGPPRSSVQLLGWLRQFSWRSEYGLAMLRCGTPVLWIALSVNSGPPWHSMQPPLPWKIFSPRSAASDIVPLSNA